MSLRIRVHSDAATELVEAVRWYDSKRRGLGGEFVDEVAEAIDRVAQNPKAGGPLSADDKTRRVLVSRFPYQLVYRLRPGEVVVVAVAHMKRRPGYWRDRS